MNKFIADSVEKRVMAAGFQAGGAKEAGEKAKPKGYRFSFGLLIPVGPTSSTFCRIIRPRSRRAG
jgi:hypothetical protein